MIFVDEKIIWGEKMKLRKQYIPLLLFAALVIGFLGAYAGVKLAQPIATSEQAPVVNGDKQDNDNEIETPENMEKVVRAYHLIKDQYLEEVEGDLLLEGAIQGMLEVLDDPYSSYMDPEMNARFTEQLESSFEGIGAEVSMVNGKVTIVAPIKDSPAERAGLRPNDQIVRIDDEEIDGLDLNEAVDIIRGEKGTEVVLSIQRPGVSEIFKVPITRDEIPLETVYVDTESIEGKLTGIITITSFAENTAKDFINELEQLEKDGIEGLVIDVRGNPGGLLNIVEDILSEFIPKDLPYIQIEDQQGNKDPFYSKLTKEKEYPISVIIDEGSASASEILAIALKELGHDVVGMTSFGKGTVQNAVPLGDGSTIKLTFYKWLSPKGVWIHEKGVEPTVEVKQPDYFYTHPIQIDEPLSYNHAGEKIENVQQMLKGLGYNIERVDGYFDEATVEATKAFQKDNDLKATGEIDETTAGLIEAKVIEKIRSGEDDQQLEEALNNLYK